jgi:hypothetical protein
MKFSDSLRIWPCDYSLNLKSTRCSLRRDLGDSSLVSVGYFRIDEFASILIHLNVLRSIIILIFYLFI